MDVNEHVHTHSYNTLWEIIPEISHLINITRHIAAYTAAVLSLELRNILVFYINKFITYICT